jgi:hypothetical protein
MGKLLVKSDPQMRDSPIIPKGRRSEVSFSQLGNVASFPSTEMNADPKGEAGKLKPQLHLVPTAAVNAMAEALADGASRYGPWNWRGGPINASVYIGP